MATLGVSLYGVYMMFSWNYVIR